MEDPDLKEPRVVPVPLLAPELLNAILDEGFEMTRTAIVGISSELVQSLADRSER